jgi:hypothetical protein
MLNMVAESFKKIPKFWEEPVPEEIIPKQTSIFNSPAPECEQKTAEVSVIPVSDLEAERIACVTQDLLNSQGYCFWTSQALRGEIIIIVGSRKSPDHPGEYPVYTIDELGMTADLKESTLRLIHHVKKYAGATVTSVEKVKNENL